MIRERIRLFEEAYNMITLQGHDIIIIDRGIIGDLCFAKMQYDNKFISEREYKIY